MSVITVKRRRIVNESYAVDPDLIKVDPPAGTEFDLRGGKAYVSLVGYDVDGLEKWGIPIPISYPVLELRYLVTKNDIPGYVVAQKFVPKYSIAWLVTLLYGEPCQRRPMQRDHTEEEQQYRFLIQIKLDIHREKLRVVGRKPSRPVTENSVEEWIIDRSRAYTQRDESYTVKQSDMELYHVEDLENTIAYEAFFGEKWAFLVEEEPIARFFGDEADVELSWPG